MLLTVSIKDARAVCYKKNEKEVMMLNPMIFRDKTVRFFA
jgi:hypothetical protein